MIKYNIKKRKNEEKKKKWRSYELRPNTSGPKKPSPPLTYFGFCFWFPCSCVRALLLSHSHLPAVHQMSSYSLPLSSIVFHCRPSCCCSKWGRGLRRCLGLSLSYLAFVVYVLLVPFLRKAAAPSLPASPSPSGLVMSCRVLRFQPHAEVLFSFPTSHRRRGASFTWPHLRAAVAKK